MGFGQSSGSATSSNVLQQLRVQNAQYNTPIPILYGQVRVAANVIWAGGFVQVTNKNAQGKGAGATTTTFTYTCAAIFAVGVGPLPQILAHWNDGAYHGYRTYQEMLANGWVFMLGEPAQAIWPYLTNKYPAFQLPYSNICYAANSDIKLGPTPNLPQFNWEVIGNLQYGGAYSLLDALPSAICLDILNNPLYGLGLSIVGSDVPANSTTPSLFDAYCLASGSLISPVIDTQDTIANWLRQFLDIAHGDVVWSEGLLKFAPYYDQEISGNGVTYTPDLTPVYNLTIDDFVIDNDESPITVNRKSPQDRYNVVDVEYENRGSNYKTQVAEAKSQADIDQYTLRREPARSYHPIKSAGLAAFVAQLKLLWILTVRNTYKFKLPGTFLRLDPLDIVALNWPELGLNSLNVRITSITERADDGVLELEAEDLGVNSTPGYPRSVASLTLIVNNNVVPSSVNQPAFIEPTSIMVGGIPSLWIGLSGQNGNQNWGGCHVYYSEDGGNTYSLLGEVVVPAVQGTLIANCSSYSGANPDTGHSLEVDLSESAGELFSISTALAALANNLCVVFNPAGQFEFLSFDLQVAGANPDQYEMGAVAAGNLYRNLYDSGVGSGLTVPLNWETGNEFCYLGVIGNIDQGIFQWQYPTRLMGTTLLFKFTSFNASNTNEEELSAVSPYTYTLQGVAVTGPTQNGVGLPTAFGASPAWQANTQYLDDSVILDSNGNGEFLLSASNVDWNYTSPTTNHPGFAAIDFLTTAGEAVSGSASLSAAENWAAEIVPIPPSGSTPPQNVGIGAGSDAAASSFITINAPAGVQAGDILLACVVIRATSIVVITFPPGWSLIGGGPGGTNIRIEVIGKVATAAEPSSYTFGLTGSAVSNGNIIDFRGASMPTTNVFSAGTTASIPYPSGLTGSTNYQALVLIGWANNTANLTLGGESGSSTPSWGASAGDTTPDGNFTWENVGAIIPYSQWQPIASTSITMARKADSFNVHFDLAYAYTNRQANDQVQWELLVNTTVVAKGKIALQAGTEAGVQDLRAIFSHGVKGFLGNLTVAVQVRAINGSGNSTFQFISISPTLTATPHVQRSISG